MVGPTVNEVSRIASMCRSVDRELLASADFCKGLDAAGRRYLVSTGRYALRGIGRAQDLYTLDPEIDASEPVTGSYERYLAGEVLTPAPHSATSPDHVRLPRQRHRGRQQITSACAPKIAAAR